MQKIFSSRKTALVIVTAVLLSWQAPGLAREIRTVALDDETEVDIRVFPASGEVLLLGFNCDEGVAGREELTAAQLADDGIEVWMPDMLSAYLLPNLSSSVGKIPAQDVVTLIEAAYRATGKRTYLIAGDRATDLLLRGVVASEAGKPAAEGALAGAVLLFPRLLAGEPDPGKEPVYVDAVGKTRLPLLVLEGGHTPNRWFLPHLVAALRAGGSPVDARLMPDLRGRFYNRPDADMTESTAAEQLAGLIKASLLSLRRMNP
ncbi:MAG: hypothetical protein U9Q71_07585 [Pseudomonadota bacterium]|nr:hypothetical protein [Pseudomonadota bacterium]